MTRKDAILVMALRYALTKETGGGFRNVVAQEILSRPEKIGPTAMEIIKSDIATSIERENLTIGPWESILQK